MSKFVDLNPKHRTNLVLNFRMHTLMVHFIAESEGISPAEVIKLFYSKVSQEMVGVSHGQIVEYLQELDLELERANESVRAVKIDMN